MSDTWVWLDGGMKPEKKRGITMIAVGVPVGSSKNYTTDQYCGWWDGQEFCRWPHPFPPTHFKYQDEPPKD